MQKTAGTVVICVNGSDWVYYSADGHFSPDAAGNRVKFYKYPQTVYNEVI